MSSLGSDAGLLTLQKWGHPTYFIIIITYAWQCLGMHGQPVYGSSLVGEGRMGRKWAVTTNWHAGTILRTVSVRACHLLLSKSKLQSSRWGRSQMKNNLPSELQCTCPQLPLDPEARNWNHEQVNNRLCFHVGWEQHLLLSSLWRAGTTVGAGRWC